MKTILLFATCIVLFCSCQKNIEYVPVVQQAVSISQADSSTATTLPPVKYSYQYGTDPNGVALIVDVYVPATANATSKRPLLIFTHGTGSSESNPHPIGDNAKAVSFAQTQGFVTAFFNFFGSDNTRLREDGKHLPANYNAVVTYLIGNAAKYFINTNAVIACGASGSAAGAINVALKRSLFGCMVEEGGRNIGLEHADPATIFKRFSFAGVQSQSDIGFGGYMYATADVRSGASHNYNSWTENTSLRKVAYPGLQGYCTAWNDCSLMESVNYYSAKYPAALFTSYTLVVPGQHHGPEDATKAAWNAFTTSTPKKMLNDRGFTWKL
jgi:hypothetical protein